MLPHPSTSYPPRIAALIEQAPLAPLGPGSPIVAIRPQLAVSVETLFAPLLIVDAQMARACHAGLWLAFNFMDESHAISQDLETPEGSYWHAILHRREPDYANSKYWFRRVKVHPVFEELAKEAARQGVLGITRALDPLAFVDQCAEHCGKGDEVEETLCQLQQIEWELLFAHCFRGAVG